MQDRTSVLLSSQNVNWPLDGSGLSEYWLPMQQTSKLLLVVSYKLSQIMANQTAAPNEVTHIHQSFVKAILVIGKSKRESSQSKGALLYGVIPVCALCEAEQPGHLNIRAVLRHCVPKKGLHPLRRYAAILADLVSRNGFANRSR